MMYEQLYRWSEKSLDGGHSMDKRRCIDSYTFDFSISSIQCMLHNVIEEPYLDALCSDKSAMPTLT